jgi:hypothetical protein
MGFWRAIFNLLLHGLLLAFIVVTPGTYNMQGGNNANEIATDLYTNTDQTRDLSYVKISYELFRKSCHFMEIISNL